MKFETLIKTSRPNFLVLPPVCVLLGLAAVWQSQQSIPWFGTLLAVVGAIAAHISVNMLNEYQDARSGLDATTQRTPFSGGSGALLADPKSQPAVLLGGIAFAVIALAIGAWFAVDQTLWIIPLGMLGLLIVFTYTPWINQNPLLCLIAPGMGFGALMVLGTQLALTGEITQFGILLSLIPFFQVSNLLLVNQYPDAEADRAAGRYHALIAWGPQISNIIYLFFSLMTYELISLLVLLGHISPWAYLAFIGLGLNLFTFFGLGRHKLAIGNYPQYMAANVVATLITPLIVGLAVLLG